MYSIDDGDCVELRMIGTLHGQQTITTFHYKVSGDHPDGEAAIGGWLNDVEAILWLTYIRPNLSEQLVDVYFEMQKILPTRYRSVRKIPANRTGGTAGLACPSGTAMVVKRVNDRSGRSYQGRIYLPAVPETARLDSKLTAAYIAGAAGLLEAAVQDTIPAGGGGDLQPVVYHPAGGIQDTLVLHGTLTDVLRYQRRREVGVGS